MEIQQTRAYQQLFFLRGGRPREIMLWTNHLHLGGKEWFVNRGLAKARVNNGRQGPRNKNTT